MIIPEGDKVAIFLVAVELGQAGRQALLSLSFFGITRERFLFFLFFIQMKTVSRSKKNKNKMNITMGGRNFHDIRTTQQAFLFEGIP